MKAAELLRQYDAGRRDFSGESLRGQKLTNLDLSEIILSNADIRGADFSDTNLTNGNFKEVRTGLQKRWLLVWFIPLSFAALTIVLFILLLSLTSVAAFHPVLGEDIPFSGWILLISICIIQVLLFCGGIEFLTIPGAIFISIGIMAFLAAAMIFGFMGYDMSPGSEAERIFEPVAGALTGLVTGIFLMAFCRLIAITVAMYYLVFGSILGSILFLPIPVSTVFLISGIGVEEFDTAFSIFFATIFLTIFLVNVFIGLRSLREDGKDKWIRYLAIRLSTIGSTKFVGAILRGTNFSRARLKNSDFSNANIINTNWYKSTQLDSAKLSNTVLIDRKVRNLAVTRDGARRDYSSCDFGGLDLCFSTLDNANLTDAVLSFAVLESALLTEANLTRTKAIGTNFCKANLTAACIENWSISSATNLSEVDCAFVYLCNQKRERRPSSEENTFASGEFKSLFEEALNTIDLIFRDGVDWNAFFQSFQELRSQYGKADLSVQAIEKKQNGAFVIRLEVAEGSDKAAIESSAKDLYETKITLLEQRYRAELQAKDGEIVAYREQSANLMKITELLASNPMTSNNTQNFHGPVGNVAGTNHGKQQTVQHNYASKTPSLAEAAAEIQNLLKQLEVSNPTATEAEQTAYLNAMIPPTRRERFVGALMAAGGAAIEEVPYGSVLKALVEGWQRPEG